MYIGTSHFAITNQRPWINSKCRMRELPSFTMFQTQCLHIFAIRPKCNLFEMAVYSHLCICIPGKYPNEINVDFILTFGHVHSVLQMLRNLIKTQGLIYQTNLLLVLSCISNEYTSMVFSRASRNTNNPSIAF